MVQTARAILLTHILLRICGAVCTEGRRLALCLALENDFCQPVFKTARGFLWLSADRGADGLFHPVHDPRLSTVVGLLVVICLVLVLGHGRGGTGNRPGIWFMTLGFPPVVINVVLLGTIQVYSPQGITQFILFLTFPFQSLHALSGISLDWRRLHCSESNRSVLAFIINLCVVRTLHRTVGRRTSEPPGWCLDINRWLVSATTAWFSTGPPLQRAIVLHGLIYLGAVLRPEDEHSFTWLTATTCFNAETTLQTQPMKKSYRKIFTLIRFSRWVQQDWNLSVAFVIYFNL